MAPARRHDQDLRDLKAEKFADLFWSGVYFRRKAQTRYKVGLFIYDVATHVQDLLALKNKNPHIILKASMEFLGNHAGKRI